MTYVLRFEEIDRSSLPKVGGKNASLGEMIKAGIRVPPGFAVTTDSYLKFITEARIEDKIFQILSTIKHDDTASINDASIRIHNLFKETQMTEDIDNAIREQYAALCRESGVDDLPVAVRSSATAEDLPTASFGQQETYLWVRGPEEVSEKVKKCWMSLFTPRAICYRMKMGFPHEKVLMSVGVQKMVDAKCAGVMFTLDPLTGDSSRIVIEANWGLGEAVVSEPLCLVNPDRFVVDKVIFEISERKVSTKTAMSVFDPLKREVVHAYVPMEKRCIPCINDDEALELAKCGKRIEAYYGHPQDIEWTVDKSLPLPDNVFIIQSRPETVWSQRKKEVVLCGKSANGLIWENIFRKR